MGIKDLLRKMFPSAHMRPDKWRTVKCVCRRCGKRFRLNLPPKTSMHKRGCPNCRTRTRVRQATC